MTTIDPVKFVNELDAEIRAKQRPDGCSWTTTHLLDADRIQSSE